MFSPSADMLSFLPPSPYETAWVGMVAGPHSPHSPTFPQCLEWILRHQREEGYWGELGTPMDSLTSTLACVVALNAWDTGHASIEKGLGFLRANMVKLLMEHRGGIPRWFSIVFPGMLEMALAKGLPVLPDGGSMPAVNNVFNRRETILAMEKSSGNDRHPPLTTFLEALPISCRPNHEVILRLQMEDGSLFHSPSATACAFMITGDRNCLEYLQTMMKRCSNVGKFCWFMDEKDMLTHIMEDYTEFLGAMLGVYRAAHFTFPEEVELHNAKIEHEMELPWLARMDHLEHRMYIERSKGYISWIGKINTCRLSCSPFVIKLAIKSFLNRQSLYKNELGELKRWSEESGLSKMGFGREKTTYCYFLATVPTCLPLHSDLRKIVAKCAIIVIIADDFFDEKGSLNELECLTEAVHRWKGESLWGDAKVIFDALDELVGDIAFKSFSQYDNGVEDVLRDMWRDVFASWLKEFKWSSSKHAPSIDEYIEVATTSIAIQVITLPACCLACSGAPKDNIKSRYSKITKLAMFCARLLNDSQSYQRELEHGKFNMVPLYMKENADASIEDSIDHIRDILEKKGKEFVELLFGDEYNSVPKLWKELHLTTLKAFWMLYDTTNKFDSPTALLQNINMAFYDALKINV
ncbi:hypothetical protein C4D60_Mb02t04750 [Musa balbisiana]|uniref:Terpene synthase metal-binding domain-containing protein n=1 Tax=Musa balbisiana TaxID=52838 RepID=A0A4V4H2G0_MUSBA|nr:hypothetical protein C4D60_Mb02t04750 [Musa balbisiana]